MSDSATPMMSQYRRMRGDLPSDTLLFFRLGDFYEMFFDDAKEASQLLDLTLTKRNDIPMCGVPYHAAEGYIAKLIRAGRKVAICEQMEDASATKGLVRRDITRVITPGTVLEENVLESRRNNYLAGVVQSGSGFGLAVIDLSTGAFWVEDVSAAAALPETIARYAPAECIIPSERREDPIYREALGAVSGTLVTGYEDWTFEYEAAADLLTRHFKVHSLDGFGLDGAKAGLGAAGAVLHYVAQQLRRPVDHVRQLRRKNPADYMLVDEATALNLDLVESRTQGRVGTTPTLLGVLDVTRTAMGARLLRDWLLRPLSNINDINSRLDAVEGLVKNRRLLVDLREALVPIKDLERLVARLNAGTGNARDARGLGQSLSALPHLRKLVGESGGLIGQLAAGIEPLPEVLALIDRAIVDEPPLTVKDGGIIRKVITPNSTNCATLPLPGGNGSLSSKPASRNEPAFRRSRSVTTRCSATTSRSRNPTSRRRRPNTSANRPS